MLNSVNVTEITTIAMVVAIGTVGLTQLIKNFFSNKKGKGFAICSVLLTAILCVLNSSLVPSVVTTVTDLFVVSLAITQLSWDVVAKGIPHAAGALLDRVAGVTISDKIATKKGRKAKKDEED